MIAGKQMNGLRLRYDDVYDILYLTVGDEPKAGYNKPLDSRFHLRIDPESDEVIGLTVFGYKNVTRDDLRVMSQSFPFRIDWDDIEQHIHWWYFFKHVRKQNRQLHKANPKKGVRKANKAPRFVHGFELFDEVEYQSEPCFIFGRRTSGYFDIRKLDGAKVHSSASHKKLRKLSKTSSLLCERRQATSSHD